MLCFGVSQTGGARLLVVATGMFWHPDSTGTYDELLTILDQQGLEVLDVEACEGFDGTRMRLPGDGHWNRDGHTFVAARVIEHIERHELLDDP